MAGPHYAILSAIAVPICLLFAYSLITVFRSADGTAGLRLIGSTCLMTVVLAHICEAFGLLPWMGWGEAHSPGHYLDLASAVLGLALSAIGFVVVPLMRTSA